MERINMESREQYLGVLRERYSRAKSKKEKSHILDEYCHNTGQARKYIIREIIPGRTFSFCLFLSNKESPSCKECGAK